MGMVEKVTGAHVTIDVPSPWINPNNVLDYYQRAAKEIVNNIRRHVDDTDNIGWDLDIEKVCSYCGAKWTEDADSPHNGGCCDKDAIVMEQTEATT